MAEKKVYTLTKTRKGRDSEIKGTLDELKNYFGYTLECGHSWNPKINKDPKTISSLITALRKSYDETEASCYERTSISLADS
jgi:hypothetical protein